MKTTGSFADGCILVMMYGKGNLWLLFSKRVLYHVIFMY